MDDLPDIFARDFGLRPQGKSSPMAASRSTAVGLGEGSPSANSSWNSSRSGWKSTTTGDPFLGDRGAGISDDYVFVGVPDLSNSSSHGKPGPASSPASFDTLFDGFADSGTKASSSLPVYDKPVYDDDIFDGVPGMKSSSSVKYEDVFASVSSGSYHASTPPYEDLLESLGKQQPESKGRGDTRSGEQDRQNISEFDELIPGFGGSSLPKKREVHEEPEISSAKPTTIKSGDPFVVLESVSTSAYTSSGLFPDLLESISRPLSSGSMHSASKRIFDDDNAFDGTSKPVPSSTDDMDKNLFDDFQNKSSSHHDSRMEPPQQSSTDAFENIMPQMHTKRTTEFQNSFGGRDLHNTDTYGRNGMGDQSPKTYEHIETKDDVWLTVSEIPLHTQPTSAPPPSRPPPPLVIKPAHFDAQGKRNGSVSFQQSTQSHLYNANSIKRSQIDELEDFAMGKSQTYNQHHEDFFSNEEELEKKIAADAAMKEAMDRAEAKFKHAKEVRERERDSKISRNNEYMYQERNEKSNFDSKDLEDQERLQRLDQEQIEKEREEKEEAMRLEKEREQEIQRERVKARLATERAIREARERAAAEARQKAERAAAEARQRAERAAVQRAAAEARERAAVLARERAEKAAAEAKQKATAEAREKAAAEARDKAAAEAREKAAAEAREKAAVEARERAAAEARERATAEARERTEKATAEAREKEAAEAREKAAAAKERAAAEARIAVERAGAEARLRAQRAAVERAAAGARERAAAAAREKAEAAAAAAAAARQEQQEENDLESFFGMGARANSAPKQRYTSSENMFDVKTQNKGSSDGSWRTSSASSSTIKKASSTTNIVDDLTSIFGVPSSSGQFQDVEGENEERRKARLERHQRTQERAAKALAEKNERDMQVQREQAERHRIAETLDFEIKRWAAGKEGNLRALLSTLQYVLWPECGWQPVSLTDLITGAAVKKVYRKATLCIHPDKVQQKGATLQQKYIAEKVFDLLKEAWNKFNSEELF
ncbi:auxilin-related protein 2-like [Canna indica]|uniref:Auxilin-related protein 2-like n=1 Tax=Canna indica TaxID=4628 RepID=A0AAQ3JR75_9LILI|nr:auxilin-related protein 2-like [Canna indica]